MLYSFYFTVEPCPKHPKYYEVQAGWAWVATAISDRQEGSEAAARTYLKNHNWHVIELLDARPIAALKIPDLPIPALAGLKYNGIYANINTYETGDGPERPGVPQWLENLREREGR